MAARPGLPRPLSLHLLYTHSHSVSSLARQGDLVSARLPPGGDPGQCQVPGWALGRPPQGRERRGWLDEGGELASSSGSLLSSGVGNLLEKGTFSLALQKNRDAWAPLLGLEAVTGRNGVSGLSPRGLAPRRRGSCGWDVEGPPKKPQRPLPPSSVIGVKWLECLALAPPFPRCEHGR